MNDQLNSNFSDYSQLQELIDVLCHGTASEPQLRQLNQWLAEDDQAVQIYAEYVVLHADLYWRFRGLDQSAQSLGTPQDSAISLQIMTEIVDQQLEKQKQLNEDSTKMRMIALEKLTDQGKAKPKPLAPSQDEEHRSKMLFSFAGLNIYRGGRSVYQSKWNLGRLSAAAMVGFAMILGWIWYSQTQPIETPIPSPPVAVKLVDAYRAVWVDAQLVPKIGSELPPGQCKLIEGYAVIQFKNGATVILESPVTIEPVANNEIRLTQGNLVARCETPQSHGFTITTPFGQFVDLGTEFGVSVENDQRYARTRVFEGSITVMNEGGGNVSVRLKKGEVGEFIDGELLKSVANQNESNFMRELKSAAYHVVTKGPLEWQWDAPLTVEASKNENSDHAIVFLEKPSVRVDRSLVVNSIKSGKHTPNHLKYTRVLLGADTVVDSYLIHFDPVGNKPENTVTLEGDVIFDRPIIAVIYEASLLNRTDKIFGTEKTIYGKFINRGLDNEDDHVEILPDRRTLRYHAGANRNDQVRVLVEAK